MSRKIPEEQYEKTRSYRLKQWLYGTKDPYLNNVEMQPQRPFEEDYEVVESRAVERAHIFEDTFREENAKRRIWKKLYRAFSVIFCISLVLILIYGVSGLPVVGNAENPVNNEVAQRYIENGLQETGAVNIVTGMILDYRAFDTLGESHVLFIATCTVQPLQVAFFCAKDLEEWNKVRTFAVKKQTRYGNNRSVPSSPNGGQKDTLHPRIWFFWTIGYTQDFAYADAKLHRNCTRHSPTSTGGGRFAASCL